MLPRVSPFGLETVEPATSHEGCPSLTSVPSQHVGHPAAVLRKRTPERIVNVWLILIAIAGVAIALADGLTRSPNLELELTQPQPLQYEPYPAALLLAAVTLPLMFAYAKKARLSPGETLLLWFVFCMTSYTKDFSYVRLPGAPIFVTDMVLVVLLFFTYIAPRRSCRPLGSDIPLFLFAAAGALAAARGFLAHREPVLVLRDSAIVVYPLFMVAAYHLLPSWLAIRRLLVWFALGTAMSVANGLAWFVVAPDQRRFVAPGIYVLISLVGVLVMTANGFIRSLVGWTLVGVFSLGMWLANARSLFVCLFVMCLTALGVPGMLRQRHASARLIRTLVFSAAFLCFLVFGFFHSSPGLDFTNRVEDNMASGLLHTSDDPFWQFRLTAWREAWRRFQEYPAAGEGFGRLFNFEIWDNDPRPHNTFLTVLYKMGLLGLLPLLAFLGSFFWSALQTVRKNSTSHHVHFLQILILAQISFCVWGGADAVLESPYIASLFWVGTGLGLRVLEKLTSEQATPRLLKLRGRDQLSQAGTYADAR